jgi:hypothetical protein
LEEMVGVAAANGSEQEEGKVGRLEGSSQDERGTVDLQGQYKMEQVVPVLLLFHEASAQRPIDGQGLVEGDHRTDRHRKPSDMI